jgi:hypothetical protein
MSALIFVAIWLQRCEEAKIGVQKEEMIYNIDQDETLVVRR